MLKKKWIIKHIIVLCSFFISFSFVFLAGSYSNFSNLDVSSNYLANVASNKSVDKKQCAFIVEPKDRKKNKLLDTDVECKQLSLFKSYYNGNGCFFGAVNSEKKHNIILKGVSEANLSFLYVSKSGFGNYKVNNHWVHQYYPLRLMFKGYHAKIDGAYSFFYISKTHANKILKSKKGIDNPTKDDYYSLIKTNQTITIDGKDYKWTIANIYLEENEFYKSLKGIMGEFLLGNDKYPINLQSVYSMTKFEFQNKYYLEHILKNYSNENYNYKIGDYNLNSDFKIDVQKAMMFSEPINPTLFITLLTFACLFFVFDLIFAKISNYLEKKIRCFLIVGVSLFPYIMFKALSIYLKDISIFSSISKIIYIALILIVILYICIFLLNKYLKIKRENKYE